MVRPTKAEQNLIRAMAREAARMCGERRPVVAVEPGIRTNGDHESMNVLLVDASPDWSESDLFSHGSWADFVAGVPSPDGRAEVDFYVSTIDGLACNVTAEYRDGALRRVACRNFGPDNGHTLWESVR